MSNLRYRFDELITTINLLPDSGELEDGSEIDPLFPNLTRDLHEPELYSAVICQTLKGDAMFRQKMSATLANSAITSIMQNDKVSEDDMYALAVAANILWASGHGSELFTTMGVIARIANQFEVEIPSLATAFLRGNGKADTFAKLNPYKILSGEYDPFDMLKETGVDEDLINELRDNLRGDYEE